MLTDLGRGALAFREGACARLHDKTQSSGVKVLTLEQLTIKSTDDKGVRSKSLEQLTIKCTDDKGIRSKSLDS